MKKVKFLLIFNTLFVASFCVAADICNVCLDTPPETQQLHTGKGGSHNSHGHTTKLEKPLFTGPLFYSLDNSEKLPLPLHSGVFFKLNDRKKHSIRILSDSGKSWGAVRFDCNENKYGTKIFFEQSGFYSPGWKTYPMPKNEKKCRWHPENK